MNDKCNQSFESFWYNLFIDMHYFNFNYSFKPLHQTYIVIITIPQTAGVK